MNLRKARWIVLSLSFGICTFFIVSGSIPVWYMAVDLVMGVGVKSCTCSGASPVLLM